jgi:sec-independent protein translocase protein TatB
MFGISFAELLVIILIAICVIGPKDMPEVARYIVRAIYKFKKFVSDTKKELKAVGDEMGLEEIRSEVERELVAEKIKLDKEITTIVDMYGNEHQVYEVNKLRPDIQKEELEEEIAKYNSINRSQNPINQEIN